MGNRERVWTRGGERERCSRFASRRRFVFGRRRKGWERPREAVQINFWGGSGQGGRISGAARARAGSRRSARDRASLGFPGGRGESGEGWSFLLDILPLCLHFTQRRPLPACRAGRQSLHPMALSSKAFSPPAARAFQTSDMTVAQIG